MIGTSKGSLTEVLALATIVDKFGGQQPAESITTLHPTLRGELPGWCFKPRPPKTCIVGSMETLCPAGDAHFFENPGEFVQRGLLPQADTPMGPGVRCAPAPMYLIVRCADSVRLVGDPVR